MGLASCYTNQCEYHFFEGFVTMNSVLCVSTDRVRNYTLTYAADYTANAKGSPNSIFLYSV
jgi:hypothetical protein